MLCGGSAGVQPGGRLSAQLAHNASPMVNLRSNRLAVPAWSAILAAVITGLP